MTGEMRADPESLQNMANEVRGSTSGLDGLAKSIPPMPEVTESSDRVGQTLSGLMRSVGELITGIDATADQIHSTDASYAQIDNDAGEMINRIRPDGD